jgi:hypothetical protein
MADLDKLEELAKAATAHLAGHDLTASEHGRMIFGQSKKGGGAHVLDIRGWGYLTGKGGGALGLCEEQAIEAQKAIEAYVVAAWNAVPELIALARRDGVSEEACAAVSDLTRAAWAMIEHFERVDGDARHKAVIARLTAALTAPTAPTAPGDGGWSRAAELAAQIAEQWDNKAFIWSATDELRRLAALRQPDTVAVTADTVRNTITCFLTADDPTHWGEFERRLARAVGMDPSTAEDASMAGGEKERADKALAQLGKDLADDLEQGHFSMADAIAMIRGLSKRLSRASLRTPADPRPDPLEALREAREALFDRYDDDKVSQALAKIDAVMGEAG